jgi:hypothetical protein
MKRYHLGSRANIIKHLASLTKVNRQPAWCVGYERLNGLHVVNEALPGMTRFPDFAACVLSHPALATPPLNA